MLNVLLKPFIAISAIGLLLSIFVHVIALSGGQVPYSSYAWNLHFGIFIVWFPAILVSQRLTTDFKRKDWWKAALRGCPTWMKYMTYFFFGYAVINFIIFMVIMQGLGKGSTANDASQFRGFSGHWMAFYSAALSILYSATKAKSLDKGRKCRNGHPASPLAKFCEECGAPAIDRGYVSEQREN
jgi:hypothetical protein